MVHIKIKTPKKLKIMCALATVRSTDAPELIIFTKSTKGKNKASPNSMERRLNVM